MPTFYIDPINGSDAYDGTVGAFDGTHGPWKTITAGATAARIGPGDLIKISKSPDPVDTGINVTINPISYTLVITGGASMIRVLSGTNPIYTKTGGSNASYVTSVSNGAYKWGGASTLVTTSPSFAYSATGGANNCIAYLALGSTTIAEKTTINFWFRTSLSLVAGAVGVSLCSDALGVTPVVTIPIPACAAANQWVPISLDFGSAYSATPIQSIAITATSNAAMGKAMNFNMCYLTKPETAADGITLRSLLGRNDAENTWYGILYPLINGSDLTYALDQGTANLTPKIMHGSQSSFRIWKRSSILTTIASLSTTAVAEVLDSGTLGSPIVYSGGWNSNFTVQDGETLFDGSAGFGYGIYATSKSYFKIDKLGFIRYNIGVYLNLCTGAELGKVRACNTTSYGVQIATSPRTVVDEINVCAGSASGLYMSASSASIFNRVIAESCNSHGVSTATSQLCNFGVIHSHNHGSGSGLNVTSSNSSSFGTVVANNNVSSGVNVTGHRYRFGRVTCSGNSAYQFQINATSFGTQITYLEAIGTNGTNLPLGFLSSSTGNIVSSGILTNIGYGAIFTDLGDNVVNNCVITAASSAYGFTANAGGTMGMSCFNGDPLDHRFISEGATIYSERTVRNSASGLAWKIAFEDVVRIAVHPVRFKVATIAVPVGTVTISAYIRRSSSAVTAQLVCPGYQVPGIDADVVTPATGAIGDYVKESIVINPTVAGVVDIYMYAWTSGTSGVYAYIDDLEVGVS